MPEMGEDAFLRAAEVVDEPGINLGYDQLAVLDAGAAGAVDVVLRRMIEERLGVGAGKGQRLQVRAPDGGAVDGIMDARVAPDGPEDAVLDVIEAQRLTPDIQQLAVPRAAENTAKRVRRDFDVLDAVDGIKLQHQPHREGVVEVDPIGQLFDAVEAFDRGQAQRHQVLVQRPAVIAGDAAVGDPVDAVRDGFQVFF